MDTLTLGALEGVTIADNSILSTADTSAIHLMGGGVYAGPGALRLSQCSVSGNQLLVKYGSGTVCSVYGAGIYAHGIHVDDTVVARNRMTASGSGQPNAYCTGGGR
jgi:hypothetical protein